LTQNNPSVFTGAGTNTFLIGEGRLWILDPGPEDEPHFEALVAEVGSADVVGVICSHSHRDHWPLAPRLGRTFDTPTMGFEKRDGYDPEQLIADGETLTRGAPRLQAVHTPGHARDHLCFLYADEETLFSGDHVMGWSTTVIAPPGGSLNDYMASLDKLEAVPHLRMYPAHGSSIDNPERRIKTLRRHRRLRTAQVLEALRSGLEDLPAIVDKIYVGVDPKLHRAAQWSMLSHLLALVEEGEVKVIEPAADALDARYALTDSTAP